jgi:GNAT superfamily N-acetyltransferase
MEEILAGHLATGEFDPGLWWLAMRHGRPVGVVLLNRIPPEPAVELVYMGVAQPMRGGGLAHALLGRALGVTGSVGAKFVALAVDQRNIPARRLYQRWGFLETARREVWIVTPPRL